MYNNLQYILVFLVMVVFKSTAQQDAQYTHYRQNMNLINPAYVTGKTGMIDLGGLYRTQWVGVEGAPKTASIYGHAAISANGEIGLNIVNDQIGNDINDTSVSMDFGYILKLNDTWRLSLGVKAGISMYKANYSNLNLNFGTSSSDSAFRDDINSMYPMIGGGIFLYKDNFYFGASIPNFVGTLHKGDQDFETKSKEAMHMFFTSGYVFEVHEDLAIKPNFLIKQVSNVPLSVDIGLNVLLRKKLEAGLAYRLDDGINALMSYKFSDNFMVGYAYDYTLSELDAFSKGSHEVFMRYSFELRSLKDCRCDRFF